MPKTPKRREPRTAARKETSSILADMEAVRREAMEFAGIGLYRYKFDGTILFMDRGAVRILDLASQYPDPAQLAGRNIADLLVYTGPRGRLRSEVRKHGKIKGFEYHFRTLSGLDRWVSHDSYLVRDPRTGEEAINVIMVDVTDRRQAEERLQHILTGARCILWHAVVSESKDGTMQWDLHVYNEAAARKLLPLKCDPGESYSNAWHLRMPPEDRIRMDATSSTAMREGRSGYVQEFRCVRADGQIRWLSEQARVEPLTPGHWRVIGVCTDITERRSAEETQRFLGAITEQVSDAIIVTSLDLRITYVNNAAEHLFGYAAEELIGQAPDILNASPSSQDVQRSIYDTVSTGDVWYGSLPNRRRDGSIFICELKVSALRDASGQIYAYVGIQRDVTERRNMETRQRRVSEGLRSVVAMADELIACPDMDIFYRRAVELPREKLGLERCAIFVCVGPDFIGTFGTDRHGQTTDERQHRFPTRAEWLKQFQQTRPEDRRTMVLHQPYVEVKDGSAKEFGEGWVAITPIQSAGDLLGVFCNDSALSGAPLDEAQQEIVTVYCSLLGALVQRKAAHLKQRALSEGLRAVVSMADELIMCPNTDTLYRRAVELARAKLGIERCAIFTRSGNILKGTYGTDRDGHTSDEHEHVFATDEEGVERLTQLRHQHIPMILQDQAYHEWRDHGVKEFGHGWVAITPIQSSTEFVGVFCNDSAISGAPIDDTKQEIISVLCSLLGAVIERRDFEERQQRLSRGLRTVVALADELLLCHDVDSVYRRAVDLARERLDIERCAIFLREGTRMRGTFGTNMDRQTTDEAAHAFEAYPGWLEQMSTSNPQDRQMIIREEPYSEWRDGRVLRFDSGWVAITPLSSTAGVIGIFSNDTAITKTPVDDVQQEIITVFCSLLGPVIEQQRAGQALRRAHDSLELRVQERTAELLRLNTSLRETERRQKAILDNIPDIAWLKDRNSRFIAVNEALARQIGRSPEECAGTTDFDHFPHELAKQYQADDREIMASRMTKRLEEQITDKHGNRFWIETVKTPIIDDRGEVIGTTGVARDISERRRAAEVLRRSHEELEQLVRQRTYDLQQANEVLQKEVAERKRAEAEIRQLAMGIEQAAEAIIITNTSGVIQYVNPAFERMSGYNRAEVIGQNPRLLKSGRQDGVFYEHMWETLSSGSIWHGRMTNRAKQGGVYEVETTISPIRDESGSIISYVSASRDVTREVQLEEQFRQAQKMEAVGRLAGGIAHDFNNLLTSILGFSRLISENLEPGHPMRSDVQEIIGAGERAAALTKQLLAFSRKQAIQSRPVYLNAVLLEIDRLLRHTLGEDIELVTAAGPEMACVRADSGLLEQVVMNLAINARDAMPKGGKLTIHTDTVTLDEAYCQTHVRCTPGRYALLSVADTGTGMPPDVLEHCFEPFYTTKERGKGTGLGLSIVYSIVSQFDGFIDIDSVEGKGTAIRIYFPCVPPPSGQTAAGETQDLPHGTETILVVEDEDTVRRLTVRILESIGYRVLEARHGGEALLICERHKEPIHLVLSDVVMPHIGGPDLVKRLREIRSDFRVLFMSGFTDTPFVEQGPDGHKAPLIFKPFTQEALANRIRSVLNR